MPKKLEEIAYQASDKVYGKEDTGPYDCLRYIWGKKSLILKFCITSFMESGLP